MTNQLDKTLIDRSNTIDAVAVSEGLFDFAEDSKLMHYNEIVKTNYRVHVLGINIEDYFNKILSFLDEINYVKLNLEKVTR